MSEESWQLLYWILTVGSLNLRLLTTEDALAVVSKINVFSINFDSILNCISISFDRCNQYKAIQSQNQQCQRMFSN